MTKLEVHHDVMVEHFLWLYNHDYAGPAVARAAVETYIRRPSCPFPKIGHDVKDRIDLQNADGNYGTDDCH